MLVPGTTNAESSNVASVSMRARRCCRDARLAERSSNCQACDDDVCDDDRVCDENAMALKMGAGRRKARFCLNDFGAFKLELLSAELVGEEEILISAGGFNMPSILRWVSLTLLVCLMAAALGLAVVSGTSMDVARVLFFMFMAVVLVMVASGLTAPRSAGQR
jgi:uncharacterized membrane protein YtjA (UPF0391 family)